MSIIAVKNVPVNWSLKNVTIIVAKAVRGQFETLNFEPVSAKTEHQGKVCYLRLSEKLDPLGVVEKINTRTKFKAFVPKVVPDLPLPQKPRKVPFKVRNILKVKNVKKPKTWTPYEIVRTTHIEIMIELQSKYTGLYNLSKKTDHQLLEGIAHTIFERLKFIWDTNPAVESSFDLSKLYRKTHPHFGDFQLLLSTLHRVQDAAGTPRAQVSEPDLCTLTAQPYAIDNVPLEKIQSACDKYCDRVNKRIVAHINELDTEIIETDNEEGIARKKVREELKKMSIHISSIINQVVSKHFVPHKAPFVRVRIYGEPYLPNRDTMLPFVRRFGAVHVSRSDRLCNLLLANVPPKQYGAITAMDGIVLSGAKLVIRPSDIVYYNISDNLIDLMKSAFNETGPTAAMPLEEENENNWEEPW